MSVARFVTHPTRMALACALSCLACAHAPAQGTSPSAAHATDDQARDLGITIVSRTQATSLPTRIPTTLEGIDRATLTATVNATDSADALKYFPSLLVRKRYIGDYNHAILSTRASGTGNSARSLVYADGILLSNLLGNGVGGLSYPPRWNLVTPEEIDRVDVMYGPFSAAYAGNSAGAVVDYVTRMPQQLESHFQIGAVQQPFDLYNTHTTYRAWQTSASVGSREGAWSWWLNLNHTDSDGQPLTFATRTRAAGSASASSGTPVSGAVVGANNLGQPWYVLGTGTQYHSVQDHLKVKVALDISPTVRASYTLGLWQNDSDGRAESYLKDANGQTVSTGSVRIDGLGYTGSNALGASDFVNSQQRSVHQIHGLSVRSRTRSTWDWEVAASAYDYSDDTLRQSTGKLVDGSHSGWQTLNAKGIWRPDGVSGAHVVDFGLGADHQQLRLRTWNTTSAQWQTAQPGSVDNFVKGDTQTLSLWAQDAWRFAPQWLAVLGARGEHWEARNGRTEFASPIAPVDHPARSAQHLSPKAALSYQWREDTVLKTSLGRAVRYPTVAELYGGTSATASNSTYVNDPNLKPERSWTLEFSAEQGWGDDRLRWTMFAEDTRDGLFNQSLPDPSNPSKNISRVQNVSHLTTKGIEAVWQGKGVGHRDIDLQGSVTWADSRIVSNTGYVRTAGDTVGKQQPNVPAWRATALATWRVNPAWTAALGARYSGPQFRTLNNEDVNGRTYMGVSEYLTADLRVTWQIDRHWQAAFGIDNLNNDRYWNFHPYPQRSYHATLRADF